MHKTCLALASASLLLACGSVSTATDKPNEPTVTAVSPDHGSVIGGTMVTVTGTHFRGTNPVVLVGGREGTSATVASDTSITFVAPAGDQEGAIVDVTVATQDGFATLPQSFTFNYQPVVLDISPKSGKSTGGTAVTITGRGFTSATPPTVTIVGGTATNVQVVDDKTITATTGPAPAGTVAFTPGDVVVTTANGTNTLASSFAVTNQGLIVMGPMQTCCGSDGIYYVDPTSGHTVQLSTSDRHIHGCTLSGTGQIYAIGTDGVGNGIVNAPRQLLTVDVLTGNTTLVGPFAEPGPINHNPGALAFVGNTLYATDTGSRAGTTSRLLLTVNTSNAAVAKVGSTAMTINRDNGIATKDAANVYVADSTTTSLDTIAIATSTRTAGPAMAGGTADSVHGLVNTGSALYLAARGKKVYSISMGANATLTPITSTFPSIQFISGMCQTPPSF